MRIYTHPACLQHDTGVGHPESASRLQAVLHGLRGEAGLDWREAPLAQRSSLLLAHNEALIDAVLQEVGETPLRIDPDTLLSSHSAEAILRACGAGIAAVDSVMAGATQRAFCAVRPPGHHASRERAMGFCFVNHIAVAALHAVHVHGLQRVAIADFDVHHGNGTEDIVRGEPRIRFVNSHQHRLYPFDPADPVFLGEAAEDAGSVALPAGSDGAAFRRLWSERLLPILDAFRPQLLLVSAGFDAHRLDPLAELSLDAEDFAWISRGLCAIADRHAQGRLVSLLEGGYSLPALRESALAHVRALAASPGTNG